MNSPCLDCKQRQRGCHDKCDSYKDYKNIRENISKQISIENEYISYREDVFK